MTSRISAALAGLAFLVFSTAGQAYSSLFIFGDSLSDPGNNAIVLAPNTTPQSAITSNAFIPTFPYTPSLQYSNGSVWAYQFASMLGLPPVFASPVLGGGTNFAFGGATTGPLNPNGLLDPAGFPPSLLTQAATYVASLGSNTASPDGLYVVAGGGNNARNALNDIAAHPGDAAAIIAAAAAQFASDIGAIVDQLQGKGAADIVVWNVPNAGLAPAISGQGTAVAGLATFLSDSMNRALGARLASETGVSTFDLFGLLTSISGNPGAYGLTNAGDACGALQAACDPSAYLFWDGIHPTSAGHAIIANAMYAQVVPEPSTYALLVAGMLLLLVVARRRSAR